MKETFEKDACKALGYDYNDWVSLFSKDKSTVIYSEVTNWCKGAKYMAEKMYSEEDMLDFALFLEIHLPVKPRKTHKQLLEQFKKK